MLFEDFSGKRINSLLVLNREIVEGSKKTYWACLCDCGTQTRVCADSLKNSKIKSCGCQKGPAISAQRKTHGAAGTPTYKTWNGMMRRCNNPTDSAFEHYGGRGISVEERWHSYQNFADDMGERPEGLSIDRIDVNGNYGPGNCRWATRVQQMANRRPLLKGIWQSIETAPKNGEPVNIYVPIHQPDRRVLSAYWTDAGWWICSGSIVAGKPTHWMPLPKPPK